MRKILAYLTVVTIMGFAFSACETDPSGPGGGGPGGGNNDDAPTLLIITESGFVSDFATVNQGEQFFVKIQGEKGTADLQALTIYENGTAIDISRITDGGNTVGANPFLITGGDISSFVKEIGIVAHNTDDTKTYEIELRDIGGLTESASVSVTTMPDVVSPPVITLGGSEMYMGPPSSVITIPVTLSNVTTPVLIVGISDKDGNSVSADRLWWNDISNPNWIENPLTLDVDQQLGFDATLFIRAQASGLEQYTIIFADENSELYEKTFTIDVGTVTDVTALMGILFNKAGPSGTGGLDLDTGASTGSMDPDAELVDEGVDLSVPNSVNWLRRIKGGLNTEVKELKPNEGGLTENFSFDGVTTSEQVQAVWDNGITFVETNGAGELRSNEVEAGQMYVISKEGKFYLVRIVEVNETPDNNDDNYVLDIKF